MNEPQNDVKEGFSAPPVSQQKYKTDRNLGRMDYGSQLLCSERFLRIDLLSNENENSIDEGGQKGNTQQY